MLIDATPTEQETLFEGPEALPTLKTKLYRVPVYQLALAREGSACYSADRKQIRSAQDIDALLRPMIEDLDREVFIVVTLDTKLHPIGVNVVSSGTLNQSLVHPREALKLAILQNAAAIAFAHNHPSGNTEPSRDDQVITDRLRKAAEIMGIRVLDHVILGQPGEFYSFAVSGRYWPPLASAA
jgi:DNA repair protein RadC